MKKRFTRNWDPQNSPLTENVANTCLSTSCKYNNGKLHVALSDVTNKQVLRRSIKTNTWEKGLNSKAFKLLIIKRWTYIPFSLCEFEHSPSVNWEIARAMQNQVIWSSVLKKSINTIHSEQPLLILISSRTSTAEQGPSEWRKIKHCSDWKQIMQSSN